MNKGKIFKVGLIAATLMGAASAGVQAQDCECINGIKCITIYDSNGNPVGLNCDPNVTCEGSFVVTPPIPPEPAPVQSVATPTSITATVNSGQLGQAVITLDTRPSPPTIIQSNGADRYPLTVDIQFNAVATLEAVPGVVFQSDQPLHYRTENAHSVNPFQGERLSLQNTVNFINPQTGLVQFSLEAGTSSITLGPSTHNPEG